MIPIFKFKGEPLTKQNTELLLRLKLNSIVKTAEIPLKLVNDEEISNLFQTKMLLKRIAAYQLPYEVSDQFFIMSILTFADSPGKLMSLLWLCHQYHLKTKKLFLSLDDWINMFPFGTPSTQEFEDWWDSQKHENLNLVDCPNEWNS